MPAIWLKRGAEGFSGVRCIHTHPNGNPQLSGADLSALINFKLDAMVAIGIDEALLTRVAYLEPVEGRLKDNYLISQNITVSNLLKLDFSDLIMSQEKN